MADVYDALTSVRPYKPAYPTNEAKSIILRDSGRHFDPVIVEAFCRRFDDFLRGTERGRGRLLYLLRCHGIPGIRSGGGRCVIEPRCDSS